MTQDEQDRIVGQVVNEHIREKRTLACLEAKAERLSLDFGLLSNWLRGHFPSGVELPDGLSVADAVALVNEIKETKARVAQLEERRAELGPDMASGPGKGYRTGMTLPQLLKMFPDDDAAREWFEAQIWPNGPECPYCGSDNVQCNIKHPTMTHRCRDCPKRRMFSLKSRTVMQGSPLGYQTWAIAIYLVTTSLKGVSSMKLHRDLGINQKSAWYLAHRIREAWKRDEGPFIGPAEADETYVGGKRKNMSRSKRKAMKGAGPLAGKTIVAGVKDRQTNMVSAGVVPDTTGRTLQGFVEDRVVPDAKVFTDESTSYLGLIFHDHGSVNHSDGEYFNRETGAGTQGIESFWAMLKRAHTGTFHKISPKHMERYVTEFAGRHNNRERDTLDQMANIVRGMVGRRLRYADLIR